MKEINELNVDCLEVRPCRLCSLGIHTEAMADKLHGPHGQSSMSVFDLSSVLSLHLYFIGVLELASGHCLAVARWSLANPF